MVVSVPAVRKKERKKKNVYLVTTIQALGAGFTMVSSQVKKKNGICHVVARK